MAVSLAIFAATLLIGAVWWFGFRDSRDPVAKAQDEFNTLLKGGELQEASGEMAKKLNLPEGAMVRVVSANDDSSLKNLVGMSEDQLKEFAQGLLPGAMAAGSDQAKRILDMPPGEQKKALDKMIDSQQAAKQSIKDMVTSGNAGRMGGVAGNESGSNVRTSITINGDSRDGQKMMMDITSPEQRAVMEEFQELIQQRMEERGLDPDEGGATIMIGVDATDAFPSGE